MSLDLLIRNILPVQSFTQQRVERVEIATPEIGLRWGKPADFVPLDEEKKKETSVTRNYSVRDDKLLVLIGNEIKREYDTVTITSSLGDTFETENIKTVTFFCHEKQMIEWRTRRNGSLEIQYQVLTITRTYARISMPFLSGAIRRGEEAPEKSTDQEENFDQKLQDHYG